MFDFNTPFQKHFKESTKKDSPESPSYYIPKDPMPEPDFLDIDPENLYPLEVKKALEKELDLSAKNGFEYNYRLLSHYEEFLVFGVHSDHKEKDKLNLIEIENILKKQLDKNNNNYYLNEYLKSIIKDNIDLNKFNQFTKPFLIQPDKYSITRGGDVYLTGKSKEEIDHLMSKRIANYQNTKFNLELDRSFNVKLKKEDFLLGNQSKGDDFKSQLNIYISLLETNLYKTLEKDFGIKITDLSIKEQFQFITYLKNINYGKAKDVKEFSNKFGSVAFKTLLSIEHGGKEMGDKILSLGEKLPKESAKILFQTYSDMIDATEEVSELLQNNLKEKATPELVNHTKESLLLGGKDLLEKYAKKINLCEGKDCESVGEELRERLSLAKKSVFAFSYACKTLVERGDFNFEDFEKAKLVYEKSPLAEDIKNQIIDMHKINTEQYPPKLRELWRGTLKNGLEKPNPKQLVVSVSFEENIVSAMRVIEQEDGSYYGASFNINPTVQGSKVGSELLKKVLYDLAKDKPFVADCYSKNPMLDTYLNKFGFKITKEIENYENTGELVYQITLFPEN